MKQTKRMGSLAIGPVIAASVLMASGCKEKSAAPATAPPAEVLVAEVAVEDVPVVREWVGETRGRADVEIRARVQGFLEDIHFLEGSPVQKGELLYSIDESELLQELTAAQAGLAAAETELAYAESDVRRYKPLAEMNAVSQRDLESAIARHEAAQAQVEAAEAILELSRINLSYAKIYSPMDGLIGLSQAKVGDYVGQAPNPVVLNTVSDVNPIHIRFPIGEREYLDIARRFPQLEQREKVEGDRRVPLDLILADGTLFPHTGYTLFVERNVDASTGTLMIEAAFPNPKRLLRPGQYGMVRAVIDSIQGARLVPQRAVQELQGQFQVWVVKDDNTVELRKVEMGPRVDDLWVVDQGVEPGERVVVEGIQRLRAGATVNAKPYEGGLEREGGAAVSES